MSNKTSTASSQPDSSGYDAFYRLVFIWLFPLLMSFGVWGNLSCLLVLLRRPKCFPFSVRLSMLICCAVDFLLVGVKSITHYLATDVMGTILGVRDYRTNSGHAVCVIYYILTLWLLHGSPFIRLGLCFHSLAVTLAPLKQACLLSKRNVTVYQLSLLLLSFVPCIRVFSTYWSTSEQKCRFRSDWIEVFYRIFTVFVSRIFVVSCLIITLLVILLTVRRTREQVGGSATTTRGAGSSSQVKTVISIFISTILIFFLSEMPYSVLRALINLDLVTETDSLDELVLLFNALMYLNPAVNWLSYLIGRKFRDQYAGVYCCRSDCDDRRKSGDSSVTGSAAKYRESKTFSKVLSA